MEDIVATLRVETRRVAVRSTDWLGLGRGIKLTERRKGLQSLYTECFGCDMATP